MKFSAFILAALLCATTFAQTPAQERDLAKDAIDRLFTAGETYRQQRDEAQASLKPYQQRVNDLELSNGKLTGERDAALATVREIAVELEKWRATTRPAFTVKLGGDIQAAINAAKPPATVTVEPGTYKPTGTLSIPAGVTLDGAGKATLDGALTIQTGLSVAGVAKGMLVTNYASDFESAKAAVVLKQGGQFIDSTVTDSAGTAVGIPTGSHGAKVVNVTVARAGYSGISGTGFKDGLIDGCHVSETNIGHPLNLSRKVKTDPAHFVAIDGRGYVLPGYGLNKFTKTLRLVVKNSTMTKANGSVLWLDAWNVEYQFLDNTLGGGCLKLIWNANKKVYRWGTSTTDEILLDATGKPDLDDKGKTQKAESVRTSPIALQIELSPGPGLIRGGVISNDMGPAVGLYESANIRLEATINGYAELRELAQSGQPGRVTRNFEGVNERVYLRNITIEGSTFINGRDVNKVSGGGSIKPSVNVTNMDLAKAGIVVKGNSVGAGR